MSYPKYLTVVYSPTAPSNAAELAKEAADAAGLDCKCERESEEKSKLMFDGKTIYINVYPEHEELHERKVDISVGESGAPEVWDSVEDYRTFFDNFVELLCQLAIQVDAEYVAMFPHDHWNEARPSGLPLAEHIDWIPRLAIYSESLLEELGGIDILRDRPPWRVGLLENGSTLAIWSDEPWGRSGWTGSSRRNLQAPRMGRESDVTDGSRNSDQELHLSDPFAALEPGDYGVDACVSREDIAAEFRNDDLQTVRVYVDEDRNLRRVTDDRFVRNVVTDTPTDQSALIKSMLAEIPPNADREVMVSALLHGAIPPSFVRLDGPEGENVVSRVLNLDVETSKIELLVSLGRAAQHDDGLDTRTIESALDSLAELDDVDSIEQYIQQNLL